MKHKISELEGALLDLVVANCKEWPRSFDMYRSITRDSSFKGAEIFTREDMSSYCRLIPNSPMRVGYETYDPSSNWGFGGNIIDEFDINVSLNDIKTKSKKYVASITGFRHYPSFGSTRLIAAMRCYVARKYGFGEEIEFP